MRGGIKGQDGVFDYFSSTSNKKELIPEENLMKILSFDEAKSQLDNFNKSVMTGNKTFNEYFSGAKAGNTVLRNYIKSTNVSEQSVQGLIRASEEARNAQIAHNKSVEQSTLSFKAASAAKKAFSVAGNMLAFMALSQAIGFVVEKFDDYIHRAENAKKASENLFSDLESAKQNLSFHKELIDDVNENYIKLSDGVDKFGRNISLSNEDFKKYQSICNQIAEAYPSMVDAWDKEGNAVVDLKSHVNDLKQAYEDERKVALNSFVTNADDVVDSYNLNADHSATWAFDTSGYQQKISALKSYVENIKNGRVIVGPLNPDNDGFSGFDLQNAKKGLDIKQYKDDTDGLVLYLEGAIKNLQTQLDASSNEMKMTVLNMFELDTLNTNISDEAYQLGTSFINSLDSSFFNGKDSGTLRAWTDNIIDEISGANGETVRNALSNLINIDENTASLSTKEYTKYIDNIISSLKKYLGMDENQIKLMIGMEPGEDTVKYTNRLINRVKSKVNNTVGKSAPTAGISSELINSLGEKEEINDWVDTLSIEDLNILNSSAFEQSINSKKDSLEDAALSAKDYKDTLYEIKKAQKNIDNSNHEPFSASDMATSLSLMENNLHAVNEAYNQFIENGKESISTESIAGIVDAFKDVENVDTNAFIEKIYDSASTAEDVQDAFDNLATQYIYSSGCLENLNDATANQVILSLQRNGIANAETIVMAQLNAQKQLAKLNTDDLSNATANEIINLANEANVTEDTRNAIYSYAMDKWNANNIALATNGDIQNLILLAQATGTTCRSLEALAHAKEALKNAKGLSAAVLFAQVKALEALSQAEINKIMEKIRVNGGANKNTDRNYTTPTDSSGSSTPPPSENTETVENTFEKLFNWIEIRIKKVKETAENAIDKVSDKLSVSSSRSKVRSAFNAISTAMSANKKAYDKYMSDANSLGLSGDWIDKIKNGTIDMSTITDESLSDMIDKYQELYEKAKNCKDAMADFKQSMKEVAETLAKVPMERASDTVGKYKDKIDLLDERIESTSKSSWKNTWLNKQNEYTNNQMKAYNSAVGQERTNMTSYGSKVKKAKYKKLNNSNDKKYNKALEKAKSAIKKNEKIDSTTLSSIYSYCDERKSYSLYQSCLAYNYSIDGLNDAEATASAYTITAMNTKKANWDAKRQNTVDAWDTNSGANTDSYNYASGAKNSSLSMANIKLDKQHNAYKTETSTAYSNINRTKSGDAKTAYSAVGKESKKAKGKYRTALKKARSYINGKKPIPSDVLSVIKANNKVIYNKCYSYNLALEAYNTAKYEEALNYAAISAEKLQNKQEMIDNKISEEDRQDEVLNAKKANAKTASSKNSLIDSQITNVNDRLTAYKTEATETNAEYNKTKKSMSKKKTADAKVAGTSLKTWKKYSTAVSNAIKAAKSGKAISEKNLTTILNGVNSGAVKQSFYKACVAYNDALQYKRQTEDAKKLYEETAKQEKSTLTLEKLQNNSDSRLEDNNKKSRTLSGLSSLITNDMAFDSEGKKTTYYSVVMDMNLEGYKNAKNQLSDYQTSINELNSEYAKGNITTDDYKARLEELQQSYVDSAISVKDYADSIVDLYSNAMQNEVNAIKESIAARSEALKKKKEYYDYDKSIRSKTKDIQALETQIAATEAMEDSLEKRKKLLELQEQLNDAQEDLKDTKMEHEITLITDSLSDFSDELQEEYDKEISLLKTNLQKQSEIINEANKMYAQCYSSIGAEMKKVLAAYGVDTSKMDGFDFSGIAGFSKKSDIGNPQELIQESGNELLTIVNPNDTWTRKEFTYMRSDTDAAMADFSRIVPGNLFDIPKTRFNGMPKTPPSQAVTINYDNLVRVDGNVDQGVWENIKSNLPKISRYVQKDIVQDLRKNGYH